MKLSKRIRKIIKWGPWGYRFWRDLMRAPYDRAFPTPAVMDDPTGEFPQAAELREKFPVLRAEALKVSTGQDLPNNHDIMPEQRTFFEFDKIPWKMVTLRAYGFDYPENQAQLPVMQEFLQQNRHVVSATISVFPAGKHLRPHKGPFKGVWRYHLAYLVKDLGEGRTSGELTIDGKTYYLQEGDDLLWDDTFMHEAINRSDMPRIVLLLDVLRSNHPWYLKPITHGMLFIAGRLQAIRGMRKRAAVTGG
ncbi:MAG: aspartyl/asparaginyl beta-hydroxylase domain-containing protein [Pseudomonadota bacterium]